MTIFSESSERKLRKLLSDISLGDRKPSILLNEMTRLGGTSVSKEMLKTLWLQHLPTQIQSVLATSNDSLENLSKMADKIAEIDQPRTFAVNARNNSLLEAVEKLTKQVEELRMNENQNRNRYMRRNRSRTTHPLVYVGTMPISRTRQKNVWHHVTTKVRIIFRHINNGSS